MGKQHEHRHTRHTHTQHTHTCEKSLKETRQQPFSSTYIVCPVANVHASNGDDFVTDCESPVSISSAALDDLCDEHAVVSRHMGRAFPASDCEPKPTVDLAQRKQQVCGCVCVHVCVCV